MGERGAANLSLYTASKHAVEGLTKSAALEGAGYGVRVNAVAPGPTETAMLDRLTGSADNKATFFAAVPLKRGALPAEIAEAVVFAASGKAAYITGQVIRVNGGKTAGPRGRPVRQCRHLQQFRRGARDVRGNGR